MRSKNARVRKKKSERDEAKQNKARAAVLPLTRDLVLIHSERANGPKQSEREKCRAENVSKREKIFQNLLLMKITVFALAGLQKVLRLFFVPIINLLKKASEKVKQRGKRSSQRRRVRNTFFLYSQ